MSLPLTREQIDQYQADGFIHLHEILDPGELTAIRERITTQVTDRAHPEKPEEERGTYQQAFLQVTNLWRKDDAIRDFVLQPRLGEIAARLMSCERVRLYHDQALFKEAGGGHTPWHRDQVYWPLDTLKTCTVWIPLVDIPREKGPLSFVPGSQTWPEGRDLVISDDSEVFFEDLVRQREAGEVVRPFDVGDLSFHAGWTLHRAGPNYTWDERAVMTMIYMDGTARILPAPSPTQLVDRDAFLPGCQPGTLAESSLTPVVWSAD